jgi:MFS family permease
MILVPHRLRSPLWQLHPPCHSFSSRYPAGALGDIVNRRVVIVSAVLWQGTCVALLALGAWARLVKPHSVLACIFVFGIGLAFGAPVWGAIVPDVVSKEELSSAITLGGVQLNLSGIVGPALAGFPVAAA